MNIEHANVKCERCGAEDADIRITEGIDTNHKVVFCRQCGKKIFEGVVEKPNTVHCPFCQSTNCKKISTASKIGKVTMFGILAAGAVSKTWHCNNCGSNFG